ncbi:serine/threonine-protein kinase [Xylaria castorea]|nr:serine/threonine-protein kinase [Xylaria castorea]
MSAAVITYKENEAARVSVCGSSSQPRKGVSPSYIPRYPPPATTTVFSTPNHAANSTIQSTSTQPQLHFGLFEIAKLLGNGAFGQVYLARHRESGRICALKVLIKDKIRDGEERHVRREIEIHSCLRHPGILSFYGWFHDSSRIVLILEYAIGGMLFKVLEREDHFSEQRAAKYVAQVALSLLYIHNKHIMHRDIKPENILLGLHGELKLADFGYSVHAPDNRRETRCGTLDYIPPEMLMPSPVSYTNAVDLWALGVLTYEFLTGGTPFADIDVAATRRRICKLDMEPLPASVSSEAKNFIHSLLVLDPSSRLPLKSVLDHPWIVENCKSPG